MKTQLLQDFEESGSAPQIGAASTLRPADPPAASPAASSATTIAAAASSVADPPSRARRRPVADLLLQRANDAAQFDAARSRQRAPQGNWSGAPPQHAPSVDEAVPAAPLTPESPSTPEMPPMSQDASDDAGTALHAASTTDDLPAWLSERLRDDEVRDARRELRRRWARRALAGGAAAAVLALLAGAGWWLYQDNRVDGALTVVANTSGPPQAGAPIAHAGAREAAPTLQPAPTLPAASAPSASSAPSAPPAPIAASSDAAGDTTQPAAAPDTGPAVRQRSPRHRQAAQARAGPGASNRREETLMQCRALGYDEGQCLRRGCAMTRFGLACRG